MLSPITKTYEDRSTDRVFQFVFHCDRCGAVWESEEYPFSMRDFYARRSGQERWGEKGAGRRLEIGARWRL